MFQVDSNNGVPDLFLKFHQYSCFQLIPHYFLNILDAIATSHFAGSTCGNNYSSVNITPLCVEFIARDQGRLCMEGPNLLMYRHLVHCVVTIRRKNIEQFRFYLDPIYLNKI